MAPNAMLDRTLDALANEHRRRIVDRLSGGSVDTPRLGDHFSMSKQALNKHLVVLEEAGLVRRERRGRVHTVHLRTEPLDSIIDWVGQVRRGWESSFDRLGEMLEEGQT